MSMQISIRISKRAADRLRDGHVWVYRSELGAHDPQSDAGPERGSLVTVEDGAGRPLGTAIYSSSSQIALRLVSRTAGVSREQYLAELGAGTARAIAMRRLIAPMNAQPGHETNAQRLLFSEADGVPGVIADRYGAVVIVQLLTQGTAQDDVRAALVEALRAELAPQGEELTIWERPDARIRAAEQLEPPPQSPLFSSREDPPAQTLFALNGLQFSYDAAAGQKTGAFLDQRLNYVAAAEWVRRSGRRGHALDVCTYQGGFALHLARVCERVTGVDQSRAALEVADANLQRNRDALGEVDWIEADAFEFLRALDEASRSATPATRTSGKRREAPSGLLSELPRQFDAIVLDPPAFAKSQRAAEGARRGYKELNLRALRLLAPGGTLITCSCSHHVSLEDFTDAVCEAASDAGRRVQLLEIRAAAPDHPELLTLPETRYLKCLICRVE